MTEKQKAILSNLIWWGLIVPLGSYLSYVLIYWIAQIFTEPNEFLRGLFQ